MKTKVTLWSIIACVVLLLLIFISTSVVFVPEDKYVSIKRFNKVETTHTEPGLIFKMPFLDVAVELPKNEIIYELSSSDVLTLDKKAMTVSSYVVWRIEDPLTFLQMAVTINEAENRLNANLYTAVKNKISSMNQIDIISSRGENLDSEIASVLRMAMEPYGVRVIDVQIKQFDLTQDNKEAVYKRMISERTLIAETYRAEGKEEAEKIKNTADKAATLELSRAAAKSEQLKAEGESEYMKILAEAYAGEERAEFYEFIRSLDALKASMVGDKTLVLPIDSPLTKWFIQK